MKISLWVFLAVFVLNSCQTAKKGDDKKVITVSILPQKTFVEKIAGNDFKVNVLIPPGASPAAYTLLPSQLKDISESIIWFRIGYIGFEHSWGEKISQANSEMKVVSMADGLDLIAEKTELHDGHMHAEGVDPHVWLSPKNVKKIVQNIRDVLTEINPEEASKYQINCQRFIKEIDKLDITIKSQLRDYEGKTVIMFHPSFSYYARDYKLNQISLESGGKEPTPKHIKEVVDLANSKNIKIIYIQSEFDKEHARIFADEIGGEVIQVAPLDPDWENNLISLTQLFIDNF